VTELCRGNLSKNHRRKISYPRNREKQKKIGIII
jgi:hypothetical protein